MYEHESLQHHRIKLVSNLTRINFLYNCVICASKQCSIWKECVQPTLSIWFKYRAAHGFAVVACYFGIMPAIHLMLRGIQKDEEQ